MWKKEVPEKSSLQVYRTFKPNISSGEHLYDNTCISDPLHGNGQSKSHWQKTSPKRGNRAFCVGRQLKTWSTSCCTAWHTPARVLLCPHCSSHNRRAAATPWDCSLSPMHTTTSKHSSVYGEKGRKKDANSNKVIQILKRSYAIVKARASLTATSTIMTMEVALCLGHLSNWKTYGIDFVP